MATRTSTPRKTADQPKARKPAQAAAPAPAAKKAAKKGADKVEAKAAPQPAQNAAKPVGKQAAKTAAKPKAEPKPAPAPAPVAPSVLAEAPPSRRRSAKPSAAAPAPVAAPAPEPTARPAVDDDSPRKAPKRSARKPLSVDLPDVAFAPVEAPVVEPAATPKARPAKPAEVEAAQPEAKSAPAKQAPAQHTPAKQAPAKQAAAKPKAAKAKPAKPPAAKQAAAKPAAAEQAEDNPASSQAASPAAEPLAPEARKSRSGRTTRPDQRARPSTQTSEPEAESDTAPQPEATTQRERSRDRGRHRDRDREASPRPAPAAPPAAAMAPPPPPPPAPPPPPDLRPPHSAVLIDPSGRPGLLWQPGKTCPVALDQVAREHQAEDGLLRLDDDQALPLLIRLAREAQHELRIAPDLWLQLAWHRDALHRLRALERAYPQGPASAGLQQLLAVPLASYQAEGALFAVCAGRALIADEPGLGKTAQAIATAELMRRHVGIARVLVLCADAALPTWQREWRRFTGAPADERTRIFGASHLDEAGAAELLQWAPELIIIDEPQRLGAWAAIPTRHALVLCGATDECDPALLQRIVQYLDGPRRGAAWEWLPSERQSLETAMASVALQRSRDEVRAQLPALVPSARIVSMAPPQREAHDLRAARATELLARWRRTGLLPDLDQWQLDADVREMQALCHRESPHAPLAEPTLAALLALVNELLPANVAPPAEVAVCCPEETDLEAITARLGDRPGLSVVASVHDVPDEASVLVRIGVPWRPMRGARDLALWRCIHLVAEGGFDSGLYDTLDGRRDAPRGMSEEARGFLSGDRLQAYAAAVDAALRAAQAS